MATADQLYDQAIDKRDAGDKPGAIEILKQALQADANSAICHGLIAKLYADTGEVENAIAHAKKVVELEPDDTFSYTALSVIYVKCGRIPEAEQAKAMAFQKEHGL
jgi:Flp pilus assembly protein TadD